VPDHALFLRGMNLGGRRLKNAELVAHLVDLGFKDVRAILASGNLVLDGAGLSAEVMRQRVEEGLEAALGYAVDTFALPAADLRRIHAEFPFDDETLAGRGKPQLCLLRMRLRAPQKRAVESALDPDDLLRFGEGVLYWLPAGRLTDSKTDWRAIEKTCGVTTTRTWGTIEKALARLD
jgi:uncharacterized protein (DUF1697 family)